VPNEGFPFIFGESNYECHIKGIVRNWDESNLGFSGWCQEDASGDMFGLLGAIADLDQSYLVDSWLYSDYTYGLVCDSDSASESEVYCLGAKESVFSLLVVQKATSNVLRELELDSFSNDYYPISSHHISQLETQVALGFGVREEKITIYLFDLATIKAGTETEPVFKYLLTTKDLDKKSMGLSELKLHSYLGVIFSGKGYDEDDVEAGMLANIKISNQSVFYMRRPESHSVLAFAIN